MQVNIDINLYNMHNACLWVIVFVITKYFEPCTVYLYHTDTATIQQETDTK